MMPRPVALSGVDSGLSVSSGATMRLGDPGRPPANQRQPRGTAEIRLRPTAAKHAPSDERRPPAANSR